MDNRDDPNWMWAQACELLDRAERLQRHFFQPPSRPHAAWAPPVDVFETPEALWILVALPGVVANQVELLLEGGVLVVSGVRSLPVSVRGAAIHRLEIPSGRFERRIALPPRRFELVERRVGDGCLSLVLRKL